MNNDILEGKWKEMRGQFKEWWGKLTDDELEQAGGNAEQIVGLIQQKYGYTRENAEQEFNRRVKDLFLEVRKAWNNIPLEVVNDGEVTALAGSMSLGLNRILGISLGTSTAGGYVNAEGNIAMSTSVMDTLDGTAKAGLEQPAYYWDPVIAPSGMAFYDAALFPAWKGSLFIGGLSSKTLVRLTLDGDKVVGEEWLLQDLGERLRDVRVGPDGAVYVLTDNAKGRVLKIVPKG